MRILVVEDEFNLADALAHILSAHDYQADVLHDGAQALQTALTTSYDAIILDVMLPGMDGLTVARRLREHENKTPILMLTARSTIRDKVDGLDSGADDYMTKPFSSEELLARIRALTRRVNDVPESRILTFADLSLDLEDSSLSCGNKSVRLSIRENEVMRLLLRSPRSLLAKQDILERVWGQEIDAKTNSVEAYISFLRKKLHFIGSKVTIDTIRMLGYKLNDSDFIDNDRPSAHTKG